MRQTISLYHIEPMVTVLGPGNRFAIWVQGCPFRCPGCIAEDSQPFSKLNGLAVEDLIGRVVESRPRIEGITISGGEPFAQANALSEFVEQLLATAPELTVMIFSGYTKDQLHRQKSRDVDRMLAKTDLLVAGTYRRDLPCDEVWRASTNQVVHYLSERYSENDESRSRRELEVFSSTDSKPGFVAGIPMSRKSQVSLTISLKPNPISSED